RGDGRVLIRVHALHVAADLCEHRDQVPFDGGIVGGLVRAAIAPLLERPTRTQQYEHAEDGENEPALATARGRSVGAHRTCVRFSLLRFGFLLDRGCHGSMWW